MGLSGASGSVPRVPLLERAAELAIAEEVLDRAASGNGALLVVEGPAGAGKTRLLREIAGMAGARAVTVLAARGSELEREFAFGVVRQALEPELADGDRSRLLQGAASAARPVFGEAVDAGDPYALLNGLFWLLAGLADRNPVVLMLDDAQWADAPSLHFLEYARGRLDAIPALIVVGTRPPSGDPSDAVLAPLAAGTDATVLRLRGLGADAVGEMVAAHLGDTPHPQFVAACFAASGGNPFLLVDLLRELRAAGVRPTRECAPDVAEVNPSNVSRSVAGRLARAGSDATALARALAVAGDGSSLALLAEVADLAGERARSAADALASAGLVAAERPLRFEHALLRAAVVVGIAPGERLRLNEVVADLLQREGAPAERIATHLLETEPSGDGGRARLLAEAGRQAAGRGAPATGARLLARALAEPPAAADRLGVLHDLGRAEAAIGAGEAQEHLREVVATCGDPSLAGRVLLELAFSLGPRPDELQALLPLLSGAIDAVNDRELRLQLEFARIGVLFLAPGRSDEFAAACDRFRDLPGATPGECAVLAWVARRVATDPAGTAERTGQIAERALRHPSASPLWAMHVTLALIGAERFAAAERLNGDRIEQAIERGSASAFASASAQRALVRVCTGDLRGAETDARAAIDSRGMAEIYPFQALIPLVQSLADQGRPDEAAALLAEADYDAEMPPARPFTALLIARGSMHAAANAPDAAAADLQEAIRRLDAAGAKGVTGIDGRLEAALALHHAGDGERARTIADEALAAARTWGAPRALGGALRVSGLLRGDDEGTALLRESVDVLAESPAELWRARALADLGSALRRANRRREAREPLKAALVIAERIGAAPVAEQARRELAASGARVPVREGAGVDELTPSELRIAELAASGISNAAIAQRLFVTVKTVEMHLTSVYRKLGVRSRGELPQALATTTR